MLINLMGILCNSISFFLSIWHLLREIKMIVFFMEWSSLSHLEFYGLFLLLYLIYSMKIYYRLFRWSKISVQISNLQKFCKNFTQKKFSFAHFATFLQLFCNFFAFFLQLFCNFFSTFFKILLQIFCKKCLKIFQK